MNQKIEALPDSPFAGAINSAIDSIRQKYKDKADDALYLVVNKRWQHRLFDGNAEHYASLLLADVNNAKREFEQCFYANDDTEDILTELKFTAKSFFEVYLLVRFESFGWCFDSDSPFHLL